MMHPDTRLGEVSDSIGLGVFATEDIPKGTITFAKDALDINISKKAYDKLSASEKAGADRYAYVEPDGNLVLCWDIAKYVNHCCEPNTLSTGWGFEIAIQDIVAGDEITDDYGLLNLDDSMSCNCGSEKCRGRVTPDDYLAQGDTWNARVKAALVGYSVVPQPLLTHLGKELSHDVSEYCRGVSEYRSVLACLGK